MTIEVVLNDTYQPISIDLAKVLTTLGRLVTDISEAIFFVRERAGSPALYSGSKEGGAIVFSGNSALCTIKDYSQLTEGAHRIGFGFRFTDDPGELVAVAATTGATELSVTSAIDVTTPASGNIYIYDGSTYQCLDYASWTGSTFTLSSALPFDVAGGVAVFSTSWRDPALSDEGIRIVPSTVNC